ncbi:hypothetical protein GQ457_09G020850 [Hibiscus cannabinus]
MFFDVLSPILKPVLPNFDPNASESDLKLELAYLFLSKSTTSNYHESSDLISYHLLYFWLFNAVYSTLSLTFSFFSIVAVVYTSACIYTTR